MVETAEKTVLYRVYVLVILLLVCVSNLATRNLPSYLITIPIPDCEEICIGVPTAPVCDSDEWKYYPITGQPSSFQECQVCRARLPSVESVAPSPVQLAEWSPKAWKRHNRKPEALTATLLGLAEKAYDDLTESHHLHRSVRKQPAIPLHIQRAPLSLYDNDPLVLRNMTMENAGYYNMADGACLRHWQYGLLIGYGFALVFAVGSVPAGFMCYTHSRVAIASVALVAWSLATSLQATAHTFSDLLVCRAVIGLAQAFAMPAAISITADYFKERQHAAEVVLSVGLYLGSGCASFSILYAEALGWRWAVLLSGLVGVVLALVMYLTVEEPERTEFSAPCDLGVVSHEVFQKSRVARLLILAASAKMLSAYSLSAFLPIWYSRRALDGYANNSYACLNALVIAGSGLLSALAGGVLGDNWSLKDPRAPCWIGLIGALLSLPLIFGVLLTENFGTSMFCLFLLILVGELWFGPSVALLQASVRRSVQGQAVSLFLVASTVVGNLGPSVLGFLDRGGAAGLGFHLLWITLLANLAAAAAFAFTVREINIDPVAAGFGSKYGAEDVQNSKQRSGPPSARGGF
mmetsp:Transcript_31333/g.68629  ORF Transcript_31333/g.68629 Transcript_31333/m.68629 type:complete len:578 (+) Transcript_31333:120-1853(+)